MTRTKKVVAIMLALLMMFSSVSVLATAWDAGSDDGSTLTIETKFFKEVDGNWVETTKVRPGDTVKARVYLGTDYYSNDSTLLFFYDKDFFTLSDSGALAVNTSSFAASNGITAAYRTNSNVNSQVANGYIDSAFLSEYSAVTANVYVKSDADGDNVESNVMYDNSEWLLEFTMTVNADASGEGDFFVKDTTVQNTTTQSKGIVNVPKGPADGTDADIWAMWLWDAEVNLSSQPVTTISSVTFNANGGEFADGTTEVVIEDEIDAAIDESSVPVPTLDGYTFMGWVDAEDETPTLEEAAAAPTAIPENDLVLNAFWLKNVTITFNTDGGSEIAPIENVTPYTDFADVADPTKEGYTFVGWDVRGEDLPATYPDVDTTYTAIWALDVVVSFDTDGGTAIDSVEGYAGAEFTEEIADPAKEGHRFVMWSPELPTVFPEQDTTYKAIFETLTYEIKYIVDGSEVYTTEIEYGQEIPTGVEMVELPEGKVITAWYTDADCTVELAEGTTMGAADITLYAKSENKKYNAIFMVDGEEYKSVETEFDAAIKAPADPAKEGYVFKGWEPDVGFMEAHDMIFEATWSEAVNKAVYVVDGSEYDVFDVAYGEDLDVPADPEKEGYEFKGWAETADGEVITLPAKMPSSSVTYYAVFEVLKYTITFENTGDTVIDPITQDYGTAVTAPEDPTLKGYSFKGWLDSEGNAAEVPGTMPAKDITLTADWEINQYTITFENTGDTVIDPITQDYGTAVTAPENPTREGYEWKGWDKDIPETMPAEDITITGQWEVNQYTITFENTGDTVIAPITQDYGTAVTAPENPTREGYEWKGWDKDIPETMPAENITITGQWEVNQYTITFENTGDTVIAPITQDYGTAVTAPENPTREGYEWKGWDKDIPDTMPAENITITGQWTINQYTVTFDTDGGSAVDPITQDYASTVTLPAAPTKEGYDFAGWKRADGTILNAGDTFAMPVDGETVTATWNVIEYEATFDAAGGQFENGSGTATVKANYGEAITAPADPTKTGYKFTGWTPEVGTMPVNGASFTATWEAIEYNAVFDANGGAWADGDTTKTVSTPYGSSIKVPENPTKQGYVFSKWDPTPGIMDDVNGKTFTAVWIGSDQTTYTVETYTMGTDGQYVMTSEVKTGTTDETVNVKPDSVETGFALNDELSVYEGKVAADNSLVLKVYIDRISYTFTTIVDGEETTTEYLYGAAVATPATPSKTGYTFAGWEGTVPDTMPAENVTVTATWASATDTAVSVYVKYTGVKTGDAVEIGPIPYEGTTDKAVEIVTAMPETTVEGTTYILVSTILADAEVYGGDPDELKHYVYDADNASNVLEGTVAADGSTVLEINLKTVVYTATFLNDDGSTFETVELDYYTLVEPNVPENVPVKEGYTFSNWQGLNATTRLTGDRSFTPVFTPNSYTITFDTDGGSAVDPITQDYASTVTLPAAPTKEGYDFAGWKRADGTVLNAGDTFAMPVDGETVTATWNVIEYEATFDAAGGQFENGSGTATVKANYGEAITAPADPTKTGYKFTGWTPEVGTMPVNGASFTATWEAIEYNAVFDANGGAWADGDTTKTVSTPYGSSIEVPENPTKQGYVFSKWDPTPGIMDDVNGKTFTAVWVGSDQTTYTVETYTMGTDGQYVMTSEVKTGTTDETVNVKPDSVETGFALNDELSVYEGKVAADNSLVLKVYIDRISYTFTTIVDGEETTTEYLYGATVADPAEPSKIGHTFDGWTPAVPDTMPAENVTVTAQWKINQYTITFGNTGDTVIDPITQDYGTAVTAPENPTREGYEWKGWDKDIPDTMPAENITITGQWEVNTYKVTWNVDGTVTEEYYEYGAKINKMADPEKSGYTFAGWGADVPDTMPAENLEFVAQWTALDGIGYKVEIYKMNTEGTYDDVEPEVIEKTEKAGAEVTYTPEAITGFTYNEDLSTVEGTVAGDGSLVLKVYYDRNKVKVNINGEEEEYYYGEQITEPERPTPPEGYEQPEEDGWKDQDDNPVNFPITVPDEDITITPVYVAKEYLTTWIVDGEELTSFKVTYGEAIEAPTAPEKEGYRFVMWTPTVPETMPAKEMEFTAIYEIKAEYNVDYYVDGELVYTLAYIYNQAYVDYTYEPIEGYEFDGWYSDADCTVKFEAPATVTESMSIYGKTYEGTYDAVFNADGGSWADGETTKTVPTVFGTEIKAPADPTREGYVFKGWDPMVSFMYDEGMTFTATWAPDSSLILTYIVDGEIYEKYPITYGDELDIPADPEKEGYEFKGWAATADGEVITLPDTMPATNTTYYAVFEIGSFTLTVYEYEASEHGPAATPAPALVAKDGFGGSYKYGEAVTIPTADDMAIDNYTFTGWVDQDGNVYAADAEITMPASDLELTPTYERVAVKLVPAEGSTTVIERDGVKESIADGTVTSDPYEAPDSYDTWVIYGLKTGLRDTTLKVDDAAGTTSAYIDIQGDGYTVVTPVTRGLAGTGTLVEVYDYVTGEKVEEFYVVIFGDIDGNAVINGTDTGALKDELANPVWSPRATRVYYLFLAADLDGNRRTINGKDSGYLAQVVSGEATVDQVAGMAIVTTA